MKVDLKGIRFESDRDIPDGMGVELLMTKDGTVLCYGRVPGRPYAVAICRVEHGFAVVPDAPFFGDEPPTFTGLVVDAPAGGN